jgi:hypothetical protein
MKFKLNDRVSRLENVFDQKSKLKHGRIVKVYSQKAYRAGGIVLGPYPELYDVKWSEGNIERGFLPHGLNDDNHNAAAQRDFADADGCDNSEASHD